MNLSHTSTDSDRFVEEKRSQALRQNEPELRLFEQKLRNAHIFKEQTCQLKEKEYKKLQDDIRKRREADILSQARLYELEKDKEKKQLCLKSKIEYGNDLQLQIDLQQCHKIQQEKENFKQRAINDEEINKLHEENIKKIVDKIEKTKITQNEMKIFNKAKEAKITKEKLLSQEEQNEIEEYQRQQEEKRLLLLKETMKKNTIREIMYEKIAANIIAQKKAVEERKQLIEELQRYEYLQKQAMNDKNKNINLFKSEIVKILKIQIEANKAKENKLRESELLYRKQLLEQSKRMEELENENKIRSHLKLHKYASEITKQIEDNRRNHANQQEFMKNVDEYVKQYNEDINTKIEKEKIKIMKEYGSTSFSN